MATRGRPGDRRWIQRIGRPVLWERSSLRTSRRYDGATPFFEGDNTDRGHRYEPGHRIKALLTSDNRKKEFDLPGAIEAGRAMMTFFADLDIGAQDRITFLDMELRQEIEIERGAGSEDLFHPSLRIKEVLLVVASEVAYVMGQDHRLKRAGGLVGGLDWSQAINAPAAGDKIVLHVLIQPLVDRDWETN